MIIKSGAWFIHVKYTADRAEKDFFLNINQTITTDKIKEHIADELGTHEFVIDNMVYLS